MYSKNDEGGLFPVDAFFVRIKRLRPNRTIAEPWEEGDDLSRPEWTSPGWHGSLEGVGGLKTNEAYHSKADALLIPEMHFFKFTYALFGNLCYIKFGPFSALLALPVMIREKYGQMAHQTLPNILLSNASLVTKSCIAVCR